MSPRFGGLLFHLEYWVGFPGGSAAKEPTCTAGDPSLIPGSRGSPGEGIGYSLQYSWASLLDQTVRNPLAIWETWVWSGLGRSPGRRHGNPLQNSCLENPHGQRSLVGYSSWGHKESDMTEWLSIVQDNTEYWVEFPELYSRFSSVIYFIHGISRVCMSPPISQFLPPLPPCLVSICFFYTSVSLLLFYK